MFNKTKKSGFTLVEVLIVIIIVGILIAALLPRLTGSQQRARDTSRTAGVNQVANGVALLLNDEGTLSSTGGVCVGDLTDVTAGTSDLSDYMTSIPKDPQAARVHSTTAIDCTASAGEYAAYVAADGSSAIVFADLEADDAGNIDDFPAASGLTLTGLQSVLTAGGTDLFGVLIR